MMSITDVAMVENFTKAMEEIHKQQLEALGKITDTTSELCHSHHQLVKSAQEACVKKCKDDDILFDKIESFQKDLKHKSELLKNKRLAISEVTSEIEQKEMKKEEILLKIEKLKQEQLKRREAIEKQNKMNKKKLENLNKARQVFQENLGLEIRVNRESDVSKDLNSIYIVTMGLDAEGAYQIVSTDPALQCLPNLEKQLQDTNNLTAFLANLRKEFMALARQ